jgi:hypothetical protein
VQRSGYLSLRHGQRRPLEQGKPVQVADGEVVPGLDFRLPRSSVISGRTTDELGEPVEGVFVFAMRTAFFQGRRRLVPTGTTRTDDIGDYRLTGLLPGTYLVMASLRETWTVTENDVDRVMGYAPTYYPAATSVDNAQRLTVGIAEEANGIYFSLLPGYAATVSGAAVDSRGVPIAGRRVGLSQEVRGPSGGSMFSGGGATTAGDGTFAIENVSPGEYRLFVRTTSGGQASQEPVQEEGSVRIAVNGLDVRGLVVMTSAGWSMSGRVTTEAETPPEVLRARFRLRAGLVDPDAAPTVPPNRNADSGRVQEDWTFVLTGVFGAARLLATVPDGWTVKAIVQGGRDISDTPLELRSGEELKDIQVIVSDRVTTVSGQLTDERGVPLPDGTIIVFADDPATWSPDSRWVRSARPDQQGRYEIQGLPPGDYLAVAIDYVEEGVWNDPDYLESIRHLGQALTLAEGDTRPVSLRLVTP